MFISNQIGGLSKALGVRFIPLVTVEQGYFVRPGHPLLDNARTQAEALDYPAVTTAPPPEPCYQHFFEDWSLTNEANRAYEQSRFSFVSNSMAACIDYVKDTDAVFGHTSLLEGMFLERGLARVQLLDKADGYTAGIHVLQEVLFDSEVADLVSRVNDQMTALAGRVQATLSLKG